MRGHLTKHELYLMESGAVPQESVLEISRHLDECPLCAQRAADALDLKALSAKMGRALRPVDEHPDFETLARFVDETLDAESVEWVREHLQSCSRCRDDVSDLESERTALEHRTLPWQRIAASLLLLGAIAGWALWTRHRDSSSQTTAPVAIHPSEPDRWIDLERSVLAAGTIPRPGILDELRPATQEVRGRQQVSQAALHPAGEVVADDRPAFRWTADPGAGYVVTILSGDETVATSDRFTQTEWTPPKPLVRGRTYLWQVRVYHPNGTSTLLPAPPAPEALFRVADAATIAEIEAAARTHPGDHLLLGILYARAGITSRALSELSADARAAPLASAVRKNFF